MSTGTIEVVGPVTVRPSRDGPWHDGTCRECEHDGLLFAAADVDSARTMAKRHWLMSHPDFEALS